MSDLISRISLKQSIVISMILGDEKTLEKIIDEEPSIDAVPVIRCKDCKWCVEKFGIDGVYWICKNWQGGTDSDGYCHEAERKES